MTTRLPTFTLRFDPRDFLRTDTAKLLVNFTPNEIADILNSADLSTAYVTPDNLVGIIIRL